MDGRVAWLAPAGSGPPLGTPAALRLGMNDQLRPMNRLQKKLARQVLYRSDTGPSRLPALVQLARQNEVNVAAVRQALSPLVAQGLVELRGADRPWLPPLLVRRGVETLALELEVASSAVERLRPLGSWLQLEHTLVVDAFRRVCHARTISRDRVLSALDHVVSTVFAQGPGEALALYRWRAIQSAVTVARCEPLRLLSTSLDRSAERVLPYFAAAIDPQALVEDVLELQEHLLHADLVEVTKLSDLQTLRLHARVLEAARIEADFADPQPLPGTTMLQAS